jgi:hypothetical protein
MGIGYTIDTPLKVSPLGIDSCISLVDDILIERLRKMYCEKFNWQYKEISNKTIDYRAKRITSYLNLIHDMASQKLEEIKAKSSLSLKAAKRYFSLLSDTSELKKEFIRRISENQTWLDLKPWLFSNLKLGSIDVNIMTKVDKENYVKNEKLPQEFNDAHAALRGYASSKLESSVILSAGMNPRLYSYIEQFDDFFPDEQDNIKKKIILKVSDFRSAMIQAKFLAKKGIWVSEFRIESGLNCGGHAFATEGNLMGPILAQFRDEREELLVGIHSMLVDALKSKNRHVPKQVLRTKITAQGGVGTAEEHSFILDHYNVDSVGWGSPFLLVPEATTLDHNTLQMLEEATEEDIYLSGISPLGVPFQNLRTNTKDMEKQSSILRGRPGSTCPKRFVALNKEFSDKGMCTASREYQRLKTAQLKTLNLPADEYQREYDQVVNKSCTCVGLGTAALLAYGLDTRVEGEGVAICPGPNLAYFSKSMKLEDITDHIYGRADVIAGTERPNMYIKELRLYMDHLKEKFDAAKNTIDARQKKSLNSFTKNLIEGVQYYQDLFSSRKDRFIELRSSILIELQVVRNKLGLMQRELSQL